LDSEVESSGMAFGGKVYFKPTHMMAIYRVRAEKYTPLLLTSLKEF
jgi:hypothetical protein